MLAINDSNKIQPCRLLIDGLISSFQRHPGKTAIVVDGHSYTYSELFDATTRLAHALIEHGIQKSDRIAIFMDNTWPCIVSIYATLMAGGAFVVINPQTKADKLNFMLIDSDAKILLSDINLEKIFLPAVKNNDCIVAIIASGYSTEKKLTEQLSIIDFFTVINTSDAIDGPIKIIPNDLAALIYTSGSTGFPKGVMQTHQSMFFASWSLIEYLRLNEEERIMLVLPVAFDYGLYQLLMTINLGATIIIERSFAYPIKIYQRITETSTTVFPAVPTIFTMMISAYKREPFSFPSITKITNTAAALSAEFIPWLHKIFPNALIFKMYGLTECKRVCYLEPELIDDHPSSVGAAIPGTEVFILSPEGDPVKPNEPGILYVRGSHIMAGYWKQPELSEKMLKSGKLPGERVLCTNDLFRMDENGLLYFIGRSDDMIKTRGEKVSPIEVENALYKLDGIKEVTIIGIDDEILGQSILAFIVLDKNAKLDTKKIKSYCAKNMETFMIPKDIIFKDHLPKSANGKIDKKALVNNLAN